MPTKRTRLSRNRDTSALPPVCWRYLCDLLEPSDVDDPVLWRFRMLNAPMIPYEAWHLYGHEATAEHVAAKPGSRPMLWWRHSAPEPRRQVSGPPPHRDWQGGVLVPDPDPGAVRTYESTAAYLRRLNLFLPGEERRLKASRA